AMLRRSQRAGGRGPASETGSDGTKAPRRLITTDGSRAEADARPAAIEAIRRRRAVWRYRPGSVDRDVLRQIAEAAAYGPSADDARGISFVAIDDQDQLHALTAVSPGILGKPAAAIAFCVDW